MKSSAFSPRSRAPLAAIRLGKSDRLDADMRHGRWLVAYMRVLAFLWMAQGLAAWGIVILGDADGLGRLSAMTDVGASAVVFFAVLDMVVTVGLWLAAAWGGVVWLVAVAAQWLCVVLLPGFFPFDVAVALADLLLVGGYFVCTFRAAHEADQ